MHAGKCGRAVRRETVGALSLAAAALTWGLVPAATRHVITVLSPTQILVLRFLLGGVAGIFLMLLLRVKMPPREHRPRALFWGVVGVLGFNVPLAYGIQRVDASVAAILTATNPGFIVLLAAVTLKERVAPRVLIGMLVALLGSVAVALAGESGISLNRSQLIGCGLLLVSTLLWSVFTVRIKPWLGVIPPASVPVLGVWGSLPFVAPFGFNGLGGALRVLDGSEWLAVLTFGILASVIAPMLYAIGLTRGQASQAGLYLYLTPIFGVLVGAVLLGESLRPLTIVGGLLVLLGVALATLPPSLLQRIGLRRIAVAE